jgi:hypothetical protein
MTFIKIAKMGCVVFLLLQAAYAQTPLVIQAETGTFSSGTKVETAYSGYTGTGYVNTNNAIGAYIEIEFSVRNGGIDTIWVFYAMSKTDDRSARLYINNSLVLDSVAFPSTVSYTTYLSSMVIVPLNKGMNKVKLEARSSNGLSNIDRFEISDEQGTMQYLLTTIVSGKGSITREPDALYYDTGTVVTLTAIPDATAGAIFTGWSGNVTGTANPATITIDSAKSVTASFKSTIHSNFYVSPGGDDSTGDGSETKPFFSLQKAINLVSAGDTIWMKGGVYSYSTRININTSGTAEEMISIRSVAGERAILDFSAMADEDANQGIRLTGSYWHLYGLDIKGAGDNGLLIERNKPSGGGYADIKDKTDEAHDNIIEMCNFYENRDAGVQLKNLAAYNKIINCDSYNNRDSSDGDADGFAPKLTLGTGNYFYGCRAWQNSDDGYDLYLKCSEDGFPQDMLTTIENCWAFMNGYYKDGVTIGQGNGNGFKLGGSGDKDQRHDVILRRCLSFENLQKGFDQNSNVGSMILVNCTGFARPLTSNSSHYTYRIDVTTTPLAAGKVFEHTNCIAVWDGVADRNKSAWAPMEMIGGTQTTCNYQTGSTDYISIDTNGVRGPRKADGSLPDITFMHIKTGNLTLIDQGTIMDGIFYNGPKPDLGCFEKEGSVDVVEEKIIQPNTFTLSQNFPNPFNPVTNIDYQIGSPGFVNLKIFDVLGREVGTLVNGVKSAGVHKVQWDGSKFPSGIYLYRMESGNQSLKRKLVLLK